MLGINSQQEQKEQQPALAAADRRQRRQESSSSSSSSSPLLSTPSPIIIASFLSRSRASDSLPLLLPQTLRSFASSALLSHQQQRQQPQRSSGIGAREREASSRSGG